MRRRHPHIVSSILRCDDEKKLEATRLDEAAELHAAAVGPPPPPSSHPYPYTPNTGASAPSYLNSQAYNYQTHHQPPSPHSPYHGAPPPPQSPLSHPQPNFGSAPYPNGPPSKRAPQNARKRDSPLAASSPGRQNEAIIYTSQPRFGPHPAHLTCPRCHALIVSQASDRLIDVAKIRVECDGCRLNTRLGFSLGL